MPALASDRERWFSRYARLHGESESWLLMVGKLPVECHCGNPDCPGWRIVRCWEMPERVRTGDLSQAEADAAYAWARARFFPKP